jgi:hypothetical protein
MAHASSPEPQMGRAATAHRWRKGKAKGPAVNSTDRPEEIKRAKGQAIWNGRTSCLVHQVRNFTSCYDLLFLFPIRKMGLKAYIVIHLRLRVG